MASAMALLAQWEQSRGLLLVAGRVLVGRVLVERVLQARVPAELRPAVPRLVAVPRLAAASVPVAKVHSFRLLPRASPQVALPASQ